MNTLIRIAAAVVIAAVSSLSFAADADAVSRQIAADFLKAMGAKNVAAASKISEAPFVTDEHAVLKSKAEVQGYFQKMFAGANPKDMPNEVMGVITYEKARPVTDAPVVKARDQVLKPADRMVGVGRDKRLCCYVMVQMRGENAVVVGIGN